MGIIDWCPYQGEDFYWTFSGGVALLNHRLKDVMPPA